uniref:Uncharacterized protein n=1 Tax=Salix viminalis TaxID=40686 RepID=A0A6N2KG40_SALVM
MVISYLPYSRCQPKHAQLIVLYFDAEAIVAAADCSSGETCAALIHRKQMAPSRLEAWARLFVTKYLGSHISTDRLM